MPFTCQVTDVFVVLVVFERFTTAVRVIEVLSGAVADVDEITTEVTEALPLLLPHADEPTMIANERNNTDRPEILALLVSSLMLTFVISLLSAL